MIDLAPHHLETVKRILAEHLPGCEVRAFGSRATWTAWEYSDLDLAVVSPEPLAWDSRSRLREAFEESDLPIRVDVVDWESLTDGFRQTIDGDCVVLQERYTGGDEWETRSLYDLADYINGRATKPAEVEDAGIPVIKIAELHGGISAKTNRVPDDHVQDKHWVRDGDLLFAWSGSVGIHVYRGPDAALNQHIFRVVARPGIDQEYLRYLLLSEMRTFESFVSDKKTTMGHVTIRDLKATYVRIPPLHEQRRIAHILGTLDDKIELNRRMSQTLEAIAQALFKSWFVDFDPVRAKAEGRPTGLPPELDALFPDSFQDSALGEIPEGWEVRSLDEIATFTNGLALQRFPPTGEGWLPVIKIAEMRKGYTDRTAKASPDIDPKYIIEDGDLLFSWSGSLELTLWSHGRGALNQHLFKVTSDEFPLWFYWGWLRQHLDDFRRIAAGKATTMGHIQRHHLTDASVVVPSDTALSGTDAALGSLLSHLVACATQYRLLAKLRDTILPNLMGGEVR